MPRHSLSHAILSILIPVLLTGCGVYEKHGYGWLARSKLDAAETTPVSLPAYAPSISQRYRPLPPGQGADHRGFDILVAQRTPVLAAAAGRVASVDTSILYGRQIKIDHGRAEAGFRLQTRYFHLAERLVEAGARVSRGQLIAYSGASGMAGVYPHLHFEVHRLDDEEPPRPFRVVDPQLFWVEGPGRVTCFESARSFAETPTRLTYPVPCRGLAWQ